MSTYVVTGTDSKPGTLAAFAAALHFPSWYGHNLDALADCLGDLSWLPEGPVDIHWADGLLAAADPGAHQAVLHVVTAAVAETRDSARPVRMRRTG